jgi:hypothetical protein
MPAVINPRMKMSSLQYINSKLSDAIYTLTTHEGDARRRIAAVLSKLKVLNPDNLPHNLKKDFNWVMETIEKGRSKVLRDRPDYTLPHIHNSTASKVIKKIVSIQGEIRSLLDDE